jgi:hypothetical protein
MMQYIAFFAIPLLFATLLLTPMASLHTAD